MDVDSRRGRRAGVVLQTGHFCSSGSEWTRDERVPELEASGAAEAEEARGVRHRSMEQHDRGTLAAVRGARQSRPWSVRWVRFRQAAAPAAEGRSATRRSYALQAERRALDEEPAEDCKRSCPEEAERYVRGQAELVSMEDRDQLLDREGIDVDAVREVVAAAHATERKDDPGPENEERDWNRREHRPVVGRHGEGENGR